MYDEMEMYDIDVGIEMEMYDIEMDDIEVGIEMDDQNKIQNENYHGVEDEVGGEVGVEEDEVGCEVGVGGEDEVGGEDDAHGSPFSVL